MAEPEKQSFMVQGEDGRKFKMVIRGDLSKIPVEKIKRYLKAYGVPEEQTFLTYGDQLLTDDMLGEDFGLQVNSVLQLWRHPPTGLSTAEATPPPSSSSISNIQARMATSNMLAVDVEGRQRQMRFEEQLRQANSHQPLQSSPLQFSETTRPHRAAPELPSSSSMMNAHSPAPQNSKSIPFGSTPPPGAFSHSFLPAASGSDHYRTQSGTAGFQGGPMSNPVDTQAMGQTQIPHPLQQQVRQLESDNAKLRREVDALKLELEGKNASIQPVEGLLANAKANLQELGKELGLHLTLDQNLSCVIGTDEQHTVLVTFDAPTERLYIYSTLLTSLPEDPRTRLSLFEMLLDGALLGRDVAGGGIGASVQSGIVMMSTSLPLRHCGTSALREVVPVFVEALVRWRGSVAEFLNTHNHLRREY